MALTAFVDLSNGRIEVTPTDESLLQQFIGGRGYAAKLLSDQVTARVGPFDAENLLIFSSGPLTGTPWPTAARYTVTAKSPLTDAYGYANSGGFFGPQLRKAGFDALVISSSSPKPVYLLVDDQHVEIRPANDLWGKTTTETESILRERHPESRVASIGPAGERLVRIAAIINDYHRAAARTGMGAVMGSKRLKAVVARGKGGPGTYSAAFQTAVKEAHRKVAQNAGAEGLRKWGTVLLIRPKNIVGDLPAKNHQQAQVPFVDRIDAAAIARYTVTNKGCFACPIKCGRVSKIEAGPYACELEGPEYETTDALGPMCWLEDIEAVMYANLLCNQLGLDTISTGVVIAFAMECHEQGLLNDENLSLEWGDPHTVIGLVRQIGAREGLGDILAEGTKRAAERIGQGAERFAMQVKGVELPRQEPRIAKAFGLGHATSNRGADHLYALPTVDIAGMHDVARKLFPDLLPELMEVTSEQYKANLVVFSEHFCAVADSVGICKFSGPETYAVFPEDIASGLSELGPLFTTEELLTAGERIVNLERMFNVRHGLSRRDDILPKRFTEEPLQLYEYTGEGVAGLMAKPKETAGKPHLIDIAKMLQEYYTLRGWDDSGIPTPQKLKQLGLA